MIKNTPQQCRSSLALLFEHQIEKLARINAYLGEIKDRIAQNDTPALSTLLAEQNLPINEIETLESQRYELLSNYGFEVGKAGMERCIDWCDSNNQLQQLYETFTRELSQLRHSIQVNGLLVNKGQHRIRRSLHLLTGQGNADHPETYSSKGLTQDFPSRRSITLA